MGKTKEELQEEILSNCLDEDELHEVAKDILGQADLTGTADAVLAKTFTSEKSLALAIENTLGLKLPDLAISVSEHMAAEIWEQLENAGALLGSKD